ncbi:MAG: BtpA/SgcQ family protein, partial [Patescibacteria group bacterium]
AEDIALFTDIHVKHAEIISRMNIIESAQMAIQKGADALIVTGKWTGNAPDIEELKKVRQAVKTFPIFIGSGVSEKNIKKLFQYANGVIVSTSLKEGGSKTGEINIKGWGQRIARTKVARLTRRMERRHTYT